jgi:NAD+ kinase
MSTSQIQRVGVLMNTSKPNAKEVHAALIDWLKKRNIETIECVGSVDDQALARADLFVCFGGDGTILQVAGKMVDRQIPVLGVNMGGLGFLTEVRIEELYDELKLIFSGHHQVQERMLLSARVSSKAKKESERRFQALNDIVVSREGLSRFMSIQVDVGGELATRFYGDGVIVATPTGSTAYSLSAGGPIIHPSLDDLLVTPICAHASAIRPFVVSGSKTIRLQTLSGVNREQALVTADGQVDVQIDQDSVVEITRSASRFQLVKSSKRSYFETLQEKFKLPL